MPRVVGLARCSTDLQVDSMPVQLNQIIEGALRLGLPEPELLQEPIGTSGVSTVFRQRPEGRKLWYQLCKGDTLIVSKIDRLGRKTRDICQTINHFIDRGVRVVVLDLFGGQSLDIAGPIGQIVVTIMAACAEIEANAIAERTRSRAQWAKAQGLAYIGNAWGRQIVVRDPQNNIKPRDKSIGDAFTVLTWDGTLSGSASLNIDPAFAAEGIRLIRVWNPNSLVLEAVHPATVGISAAGATIITGGTAAISTTVSNSAASPAASLDYTLGASVTSGSATLGPVIPASGSLAQSASQASTVMATSTNLGANTVTFTASDPNSSNSSQSTTATLTVLGHAAPSLSVVSGNSQTVIVGATGISAGLSLSNGTSGQTGLASLDVNSLGSGVSGLTGGAMIPSGSAQSYTAALSAGTLGVQTQTFSLNVSDDHTLPGAAGPADISTGVTLTVLGHAAPDLSVTNGNNQIVIVGATGINAGLNLSNGTSGQSGLASLDVNSLGFGVNDPTGGALVASGLAQSYTAALRTSTLGSQIQTFLLNVGDDQTLPGASAPVYISTGVNLTVLGHAAPSLNVASGNSQTVIVGATGISAGLTLSNGNQGQGGLASLDVNSLGAGVSGPMGGALVTSGSSQSYTAALDTSTVGTQTQTFSFNVGDDHTLPGALAPTNISASTTLTVLDHAAGSATVTSGNGFLAHTGATGLSASIAVSNAAGTRSDLEVDSAPTISNGTLSSGPAKPYYVPAGTGQAYTATFNAGNTPGVFSDTVTFASAGDNQSLPGANSPGSLSVSITGNVYSGKAEWNATTGVWGTSANWKDTVGGGPSGAPGVSGYATDTATFGSAVPSGTAVVNLDGAAPVLSNLIFSNSNASYTISQGPGTTGLTLIGTDSSSAAAVTVISGTHSVDAPILLGSNLVVSDSGNLAIGGNLTDGGLAKSMTLDGPGELILSGSNTYSGGTVVNSGNLIVTSSYSVPDGGSLTVGAGGTLIFDPSMAAAPVVASSVSPVPEPRTLVMLCAGALGLLAFAWRRRRAA